MERLYFFGARFYPKTVQKRADLLLRYCGSPMLTDEWLGRNFLVTFAVFFMASVVFILLFENYLVAILALVVALGIYQMASMLLLYFKADSRGRAVDKVLPNMLMLIAANLNSGMTPFQSFQMASRPEFGILKDETDKAVSYTLGGMPFSEALIETTLSVKSQTYKNVIELFVEGMRSGAPLATLLNDIANDIIENLDLSKEIVTRSKSYIMFIGFIVVLGGPLLSAVSLHFIRTISDITSEVVREMPEVAYMGGINFGPLAISPEFLYSITIINLALTSIIASWLLAVISKGNDRYIVKYVIIILPACEFMFLALNYLIEYLMVTE